MSANGVNKAIVVGNLARDAELARAGEQDTPKLSFRLLATTRKGSDGEHTEGFNCVVWGKRAEGLAEHLTQGTRLYVEGEVRTRSYDEDGERRYFTELHVRDLIFQPRGGNGSPAVSDEEEIPY